MRLLLFVLFFIGQLALAESNKNLESKKSLRCKLAVFNGIGSNDIETEQELKLKGFDEGLCQRA